MKAATRDEPLKLLVSHMRRLRDANPIALTLVTLLFAASVEAAEIYQWTDKQGKAHYSDVVPPRYEDMATPITISPPPSLEEQDRAIQRAAKDRARAAEASAITTQPNAISPAQPVAAPPAAKRPPFAPSADTDCETWRRLYRESMACFGPYRTTRGATKAEAFEHCTPVLEPPARCGRNTQ